MKDLYNISLHVAFMLMLGYYVMSAMQWYSYKIERVLFHYGKYEWHAIFFVAPVLFYYFTSKLFLPYVLLFYGLMLFFWYRKLDKKLVFTARIKRFFLFLFLVIFLQDALCVLSFECDVFGVFIPLVIAMFASFVFEKILFEGFRKEAKRKIDNAKNLTVIAITASYGKTSIKNFLHHILSSKFNVYMTPRSVNTLSGIMKDINENLKPDCEIYIVEAGARVKGDIDEIARLVNEHYAIVGCIGEQHIEYFKSLENIRNTKMELINSKRLKKAFVHVSANVAKNDKIEMFGDDIHNLVSTLDGINFDILIDGKMEHFSSPLLGDFNATNIDVCIHVALSLGMNLDEIRKAVSTLNGVEHRLQKIEAGGKIIIDDGFNGNFEGMCSSYELVSNYAGRKVIVTPGIVESTNDANIKLAKKIDDIFDLVIITGSVNQKILDVHIQKTEKIVIKDKAKLQDVLAENTTKGDLILFSNDAPTFL
ncbi:MAG: UDP-N-acetylmuramoyl-tripeptide--D-alanyl-D-alanine ligase [Sulfurospirillaceae bacterium]|nr:UDP-N-acetylmuramoyl-tripeptide--D-alanyl-D-alanine ligase [Sulfurospirillaceae bacterium]